MVDFERETKKMNVYNIWIRKIIADVLCLIVWHEKYNFIYLFYRSNVKGLQAGKEIVYVVHGALYIYLIESLFSITNWIVNLLLQSTG